MFFFNMCCLFFVAVARISLIKCNWVGHVARMDDARWIIRMVESLLRFHAYSRSCTDDIKRVTINWNRVAIPKQNSISRQ